ncbi:MAG: hypothetical protein AMJ68_05680 [Acidithiobacillales bacterium SG8_45]|jgi:uncharacterized membrane protein YecN with MAPEG domain|nr:MAG: hypothetical protein AMJ68_05680 [Acidithiobacillales bacterium SG8_45]
MITPVTAIYASILGLLFVVLSLRVVMLRRRDRVPLGHGASKPLRRAIRVQANAAEYLPFILILMALLELNGGAGWELHIYGIAIVAARMLHAFWLSRFTGGSFGRYWGTFATVAVLVSLAIANLRLVLVG